MRSQSVLGECSTNPGNETQEIGGLFSIALSPYALQRALRDTVKVEVEKSWR